LTKAAQRFAELLKELGACREAKRWAFGMTLEEAWEACPEKSWMTWFVRKTAGRPGYLTEEQYIDLFEATVPADLRCNYPFCPHCLARSMSMEELRLLFRVERVGL
jgi:hypothetical protein